MVAFKLARELIKHKRDNLVDIAGYAQTVQMVEDELAARAHPSIPNSGKAVGEYSEADT